MNTPRLNFSVHMYFSYCVLSTLGQERFYAMCILESVQPFLHLSNNDTFFFSPNFLKGKLKRSQISNKVRNACTHFRIHITFKDQKCCPCT